MLCCLAGVDAGGVDLEERRQKSWSSTNLSLRETYCFDFSCCLCFCVGNCVSFIECGYHYEFLTHLVEWAFQSLLAPLV